MPTLPPAAADCPRTAVLDLAGWRTGALLQALAQAQTQGQALDYVVCVGDALDAVRAALAPAPAAGLQALCAQLPSVHGAGWHRIDAPDARLRLWLGVGDPLECLRQLRLQADRVLLDALAPDAAVPKALARCCRRGTLLGLADPSAPPTPEARALWAQQGFRWTAAAAGAPALGEWNPPWEIKTSREPWRAWRSAPGRCVVLGAGIAGAAVASALARRGWQVQVLDAHAHPAAGASGLPVGLAAPYATADDSPLARLTRHGVRLLQQQAHALLHTGRDWAPSGVLERQGGGDATGHWQPHACWIKPAALVQAWLRTPGVEFLPHRAVHHLQRAGADWQLLDASDQLLAQSPRVVLANAAGARAVLGQSTDGPDALALWPATHSVRGLVSWGTHAQPEARPFPAVPLHGNGSLIAHVPFGEEERWFVGASYQPVSAREAEWPDDKNHGANALRLEKLAPALFAALSPELEAQGLQAWKGQRCVSADRLPLLGPVASTVEGLWACAGFGSRGLSLVAVCAELLAAQWSGEPWPVDASLAQALLPQRKRAAGRTD